MDDYNEARRQTRRRRRRHAGAAGPGRHRRQERLRQDHPHREVVPELVKLGLRVGTVKHDAHSFEIDHPGKDSWRHGQAGAHAYVIASPERLAYIAKLDGEMPLADIVRRYFAGFDLVVAEGYKHTAPHRVEIFRAGAGHTVAALRARRGAGSGHRYRAHARSPLRPRRRRRPGAVPRRAPRHAARVLTDSTSGATQAHRSSRRTAP